MARHIIVDDDGEEIQIGGNVELIGEALRGLQDHGYGYIGAGGPPARRPQGNLSALRSALGGAAQARAARHAPMQKVLASPYKDGTQFGVEANGTFTPSSWQGSTYPVVNGLTRVYQSFKPEKAIVDEDLLVTFDNTTLGSQTVSVSVADGGDLILVSAFAGSYNCFPTAPNQTTGLSGRALASNSLGNGISWPTINGGIDLSIGFAVKSTAVYRAPVPSGYTQADITSIQVLARLNLMGPSLR